MGDENENENLPNDGNVETGSNTEAGAGAGAGAGAVADVADDDGKVSVVGAFVVEPSDRLLNLANNKTSVGDLAQLITAMNCLPVGSVDENTSRNEVINLAINLAKKKIEGELK